MNQTKLDRNFRLLYYQVGARDKLFKERMRMTAQEVDNILKRLTHVDQKVVDLCRIEYGVDLASDSPKIASHLRGAITLLSEQDIRIRNNFIKYIRYFNIPQKYIASFFGMHLQTINNVVHRKCNLPRMVSSYFYLDWGINLSDTNLDVAELSVPKELLEHVEECSRSKLYSNIQDGDGARQNFVNLYKSKNMSAIDFAKSLGYKSGSVVAAVLRGGKLTRSMVIAVQQKYGVDLTSPDFKLEVHENTKEEATENLQYLLNVAGITMTAFAKDMNVDLSYVAHLLKGRRNVSAQLATKVKLQYGVDLLHDTKEELKEKLAESLGNAEPEQSYVIMDGATFEMIKTRVISQYLTFNYGERRKDVKVFRQITV